MKKQLLQLSVISALLSTVAACNMHSTNSPTTMAPGTYKTSESNVDANGTKTTTKNTTTVAEDAYGNKTAVVEKKSVNDPKGLMNKSTSKSTTVVND